MRISLSVVDCQLKESDDEAETFCFIIFRTSDLENLFQGKCIAYIYFVAWSKRVEIKMNSPEECFNIIGNVFIPLNCNTSATCKNCRLSCRFAGVCDSTY